MIFKKAAVKSDIYPPRERPSELQFPEKLPSPAASDRIAMLLAQELTVAPERGRELRCIESLAEYQRLADDQRHYVVPAESVSTKYPIQEVGEELIDLRAYLASRGHPGLVSSGQPLSGGTLLLRSGAAERLGDAIQMLQQRSRGTLSLYVDEGYRALEQQELYFCKSWIGFLPTQWEKMKTNQLLRSGLTKLQGDLLLDDLTTKVLQDMQHSQQALFSVLESHGLSQTIPLWRIAPEDCAQLLKQLSPLLGAEEISALCLFHRSIWDINTLCVADPKLVPPHTTGGAVDCTLMDTNSAEKLDMGDTPFNAGSQAVCSGKQHMWSDNISAQAQANRRLLYEVMWKAGFTAWVAEWWHFSYGDQLWALVREKPYAMYGSVRLDREKER